MLWVSSFYRSSGFWRCWTCHFIKGFFLCCHPVSGLWTTVFVPLISSAWTKYQCFNISQGSLDVAPRARMQSWQIKDSSFPGFPKYQRSHHRYFRWWREKWHPGFFGGTLPETWRQQLCRPKNGAIWPQRGFIFQSHGPSWILGHRQNGCCVTNSKFGNITSLKNASPNNTNP